MTIPKDICNAGASDDDNNNNNNNIRTLYNVHYNDILEKIENVLRQHETTLFRHRSSGAISLSSKATTLQISETGSEDGNPLVPLFQIVPDEILSQIENLANEFLQSEEGKKAIGFQENNIGSGSGGDEGKNGEKEQEMRSGLDDCAQTTNLLAVKQTVVAVTVDQQQQRPSSSHHDDDDDKKNRHVQISKRPSVLGRLFRRSKQNSSSSSSSSSSFPLSEAAALSSTTMTSSSSLGDSGDERERQTFQFLVLDPFISHLQLLLEKLESYAHAKQIASKFLSRKYLNDVHNVLLSLECHVKDVVKSQSRIGTPSSSSSSGPVINSNDENHEVDVLDHVHQPHGSMYRDLLPPEARQVWDMIIEQQKTQHLKSQQVNKYKQEKDDVLERIENQTRLSFAEFLDAFMRFVDHNREAMERHMNPFIHVRVAKKFELKKFHYILFKFFIQTHSLIHLKPSAETLATIAQRSGGSTRRDTSASSRRRPQISPRNTAETTEESLAQDRSADNFAYLQKVMNEQIRYDIDHNLRQFESIHLHELYVFTREQDLLQSFASILLDEEKELTNTKRLIAATCCNLARFALEMSFMHKYKFYNAMQQYYNKLNSTLSQGSKESTEIVNDEKRFAEFRRNVAMESAFKEATDWRAERHRRHYEVQLRDLMREEFEQLGFQQLPMFTFESALAAELASTSEKIIEEFFCSFVVCADDDNVNNIQRSTSSSFHFEPGVLIVTTKRVYFVSHASSSSAIQSSCSSMSSRDTHLLSTSNKYVMSDMQNRTMIKLPYSQLLDVQYVLASRFAPTTLSLIKRDGQIFQFSNVITVEHCYAHISGMLERAMFEIKQHGEVEIIKQGYLVKQGKNVKNWKRRWFILYVDRLIYRKSERGGRDLGQIMARNMLGVERELNASRTKYPNCFSVLTVGRRYRIQCSCPQETKQWITAIQTTLKRQNLEFPYVYFGLFKRNIRGKFQWRILQFDFLTKTLKNLSGDKVKRQFQFNQIESVLTDDNNPLHVFLTFRNYSHGYELYLQTPRQAQVMRNLVKELQEKKQFFTIKEALELEPALNVKSGFAFELIDTNSGSTLTNETGSIVPEVLMDEDGSMSITMKNKHSSDNAASMSDEQLLLSKTTIKRWLIIQAGELIVFNGSCDGCPLYAVSLHETKIVHRKHALKISKKRSLYGKQSVILERAAEESPETEEDNVGEILVISFGGVEKIFEFASSQERISWQKILARERQYELDVFERMGHRIADEDDGDDNEDEDGDIEGENEDATLGGVKILNWFSGGSNNGAHDGENSNLYSESTDSSATSSPSLEPMRIYNSSPSAAALVSNVGFQTLSLSSSPSSSQHMDSPEMVQIRKRSRIKSLRLAKSMINFQKAEQENNDKTEEEGERTVATGPRQNKSHSLLRQTLVKPMTSTKSHPRTMSGTSDQSDDWDNDGTESASEVDDDYEDEDQDSE